MKIRSTRNYPEFVSSDKNRHITEKDRVVLHKLERSMRTYGFLPFPIMVKREGERWKILDGQHRFITAQKLNLPVLYVETDRDDIVIAECAAAQCPWRIFDFIHTYAAQGKSEYIRLIEFHKETELPLTACCDLLAGQTGSGNVCLMVKAGTFTIRDMPFAKRVANLVNTARKYVPWAINKSSITALARFARVPEFSDEQLIQKMDTHTQLLKVTGTVEDYSEMYETLYNYKAHERIPLAFRARELAAKRSAAKKKLPEKVAA